MSSERDLAQALSGGLAASSLFRWGWAALETDAEPPSLPLVTLTRVSADASALADMCAQDIDLEAEVTVETHAFARGYEAARLLQDEVRAIVLATDWRLLAEQDSYDSAFRAWRITAQWSGVGALLAWEGAPAPMPPPDGDEPEALFIALHRYIPPEPPPAPRGFSPGFDGGFQ